jgi:hypothetical protein
MTSEEELRRAKLLWDKSGSISVAALQKIGGEIPISS